MLKREREKNFVYFYISSTTNISQRATKTILKNAHMPGHLISFFFLDKNKICLIITKAKREES